MKDLLLPILAALVCLACTAGQDDRAAKVEDESADEAPGGDTISLNDPGAPGVSPSTDPGASGDDLDDPGPPPDSTSGLPLQRDCSCVAAGLQICEFTLSGYEPGAYHHPGVAYFSRSVTSFLERPVPKGKFNHIRKISIVGRTDGIRYRGGLFWKDVPYYCRNGRIGELSERDLGVTRYCIVQEAISKKFGQNVPIAKLKWITTTDDVPDGGTSGYQERRVDVKMYLRATNCT